MATFDINIFTFLDGQHFEEMEDKIKKLLEKENLQVNIINNVTGNEMTVNRKTIKREKPIMEL